MRLLLRDRFATVDKIRRIRVPLLVIAGGRDRIVPIENSRRLYDAAVASKSGSACSFKRRSFKSGSRCGLFIALALINDPELLFLDELTTGLDPQARRAIWDLVRWLFTAKPGS